MLFIGLMSGTSTDGVDAALCRIQSPQSVQVLGHHSIAMPRDLRNEILALNTSSYDELHRAALVSNHLAQLYGQTTLELLHKTNYKATEITAIGVHGQTVRHAPHQGFTIQLNNPALLAELTHIHVIADFRIRDIAAGGQGAPLVPTFHQAVFNTSHPRVILNLGGIANISLLRPNQPPQGFDTGPANALMDEWIHTHQGLAYDDDGAWAASGEVSEKLLQQLLNESWLQLAPPKSTGRDLFNQRWLLSHLAQLPAISPADVQATLAAFTAQSVADAIRHHAKDTEEIIVCGGGAYNRHLLKLIQAKCNKPVHLSDGFGMGAQQVEAAAFAWFAYAYWHNIPAGQPAITGARHSTILGAWHKA